MTQRSEWAERLERAWSGTTISQLRGIAEAIDEINQRLRAQAVLGEELRRQLEGMRVRLDVLTAEAMERREVEAL